jgi:hypothetical protein
MAAARKDARLRGAGLRHETRLTQNPIRTAMRCVRQAVLPVVSVLRLRCRQSGDRRNVALKVGGDRNAVCTIFPTPDLQR